MDPEDEQDVQEEFNGDCVLGPVPFGGGVGLRFPVVFAGAIEHTFEHHHEHQGEEEDDLGYGEVVEINGFRLLADMCAGDTLLEEQSVDE